MHYQSERVPRSLTSTGRVGTRRDLAGSDGEFFGVDPAPTAVDIEDARGAGFTLDGNGFCMVSHAWEHIDYYDNTAILNTYYAEVETLVRAVHESIDERPCSGSAQGADDPSECRGV